MGNNKEQELKPMSVGAHVRFEMNSQRAWATRMDLKFKEESQPSEVQHRTEPNLGRVITTEERESAIRRYFS